MSKRNKKNKNETPTKLFLLRELKKIMTKPISKYFKVEGVVDDNIQKWEIYIIGPPSTLYEGGVFRAIMEFPDEYPMEPPTMTFVTPIFHPNIYKSGKVCISTLQQPKEGTDGSHYWRPVLGVDQAILSVVSLLSDPNILDPANAGASSMFKADLPAFKARCKLDAKRSLLFLPEGFEYPEVFVSLEETKNENSPKMNEESEEIDDQEEEAEDDEEEDWEYDLEDLSQGGDSDEEEAYSSDDNAVKDAEKEKLNEAEERHDGNEEVSGQKVNNKSALQNEWDDVKDGPPPPNARRKSSAASAIGAAGKFVKTL